MSEALYFACVLAAGAALWVVFHTRAIPPEIPPLRCATCGEVIEGRCIAYPTRPPTLYCSRDCADEMPWCEACGSYHHLTNPTCFLKTGQRRSR